MCVSLSPVAVSVTLFPVCVPGGMRDFIAKGSGSGHTQVGGTYFEMIHCKCAALCFILYVPGGWWQQKHSQSESSVPAGEQAGGWFCGNVVGAYVYECWLATEQRRLCTWGVCIILCMEYVICAGHPFAIDD